MKYSVGDSFAGQTMDTFHIVEVDETKESYKFKVINEDGVFERFEEITEVDFESEMDWQML